VLTPRRTVLLLAGFVLFGTAYFAYTHLLGWLDGLPQLPDKFLKPSVGEFRPPERNASPTQQKLAEAFGPKAPETDYALYETQLEFRNGESSVVVAAGPAPNNPSSKRVTLSPFSLALFGKPKPAHLRQPGEATEITTIHSDKAVLEFDRVITNPADMRTAKLVRLELVSDFEQTFDDPRRGTVHIVNNQKFADPNRFLVIRTPGPVFYRDPKAVAGTPAAQGPDLWTDAPVEIVDRQNLPRAVGAPTPVTAAIKGEEARTPATVADVLAGRRPPPPTVTAVGLRVYLEPDPPPGQPKPKKAGGMHGLRKLDLLEQVVVNLWVDNGQSMVGGPPADGQKSGLAMVPPPREVAAVGGNLSTAGYAARLQNRALLQIDTRGPFAYDAARDVARFDVVPHSDPNLPNDVQVTKVPAKGGTSSLFSQVLELEMNGGATAAARPANTPAVKKLHAWTYTAGRFLTVASQDELMEAYGQDLVHEQAANRTTLTGAPLYVVRERNVLSAGAPQRAATLVSEPGPPPAGKAQITVRGAGRVELFDAGSNANTVSAVWQTSLVQTREVVNGRDQDLFTFTGGSKFEDVKADYWLKGDVLKLWLEPRGGPPTPAKLTTPPGNPPTPTTPPAPALASGATGQAKPSRIQAVGNVTSHSAEYDVEQTTQLNVFFSDAAPAPVVIAPPVAPKPADVPAAPAPLAAGTPPPAAPAPVVAVAPKVEPKDPPRPKPPTKIRARTVDTWVTRIAQAPTPAANAKKPAATPQAADKGEEKGPKYQLDRARCEDDVVVHQDPTDPAKPRGVDILGRLLLIDGAPEGSKLTVYGWPNRPGEVHQEEMSLLGPEVVLDQIHNAASVVGRGALTMPTNSDLSGGDLKHPEVVVIHWRDRMSFRGALRSAEFEGKVSARQGESWVLCHTMQVTFDRPVFFNQAQKRAAPQAGEKPKLDVVRCYPAAADSADNKDELFVCYNQVEFDATGKMVKSQLLKAQVLEMFAQFQDSKGGEKYQLVKAEGPGRLRVWQAGEKDPAGPTPGAAKPAPKGPPAPGTPAPKAAEPEQEMKLTQVDFRGGMTAVDKGKRYQEATFDKSIEVFSVPADSPSVAIERNRLPPRAIMLTCADKLVVWSHKKQPNAPAAQRMLAKGNAYLRSDEHDGYGETIEHEEKRVTLTGTDALPARVAQRFNSGPEQAGGRIVYDRSTGAYQVTDSTGGTFGPSPRK
jgi:hypothetical protein